METLSFLFSWIGMTVYIIFQNGLGIHLSDATNWGALLGNEQTSKDKSGSMD